MLAKDMANSSVKPLELKNSLALGLIHLMASI